MSKHDPGPPPRHDRDPADDGDDPGLALRIAAAVRDCPLVTGLHSGDRHTITTDTAYGWVVGVLVARDVVIIGVTRRPFADLDAVMGQVRSAAAALAPSALVSISVRDDPDGGAAICRAR